MFRGWTTTSGANFGCRIGQPLGELLKRVPVTGQVQLLDAMRQPTSMPVSAAVVAASGGRFGGPRQGGVGMSEVPEIGAFVNAHSGVPTGAGPPVAPRVRSRSRLLETKLGMSSG